MSETHAVSNLPAAACLWTKGTHVAERKRWSDVNGSPLSRVHLFCTTLNRIFAKIPLFSHFKSSKFKVCVQKQILAASLNQSPPRKRDKGGIN